MPLLNRRKQFASAIEAVSGTSESTLKTDTANYDILALNPSASFDLDTFDREYARDTITAAKSLVGRKSVTYSFQCELNGFNDTAEPGWSKWLKASGMRMVNTSMLDLGGSPPAFTYGGAIEGPFRHNEIVDLAWQGGGTGGTPGTLRVLHDFHEGRRLFLYYDLQFTPGAATGYTGLRFTGRSSGNFFTDTTITSAATWDSSVEPVAGYTWFPISGTLKSARVDYTTGTAAWDDQPVSGDILEERSNTTGVPTGVRIKYVSDDPNFATNGNAGEGKFYFEYIRGGTLTGDNALYNLTQAVYAAGDGAGGGSPLDAAPQETYVYGQSLSTALNEDGVFIEGSGVRSNVQFIFEANRPVKMQFDSRGALEEVGDFPFVSGTSEDLTNPPLWKGVASIAVSSNDGAEAQLADEQTPCIANMTIDLGNTLTDRICASAANGVEEVSITERNGTGSLDPEATYENDIPWLTQLLNATTVRFDIELGTTATNKFLITMPGIVFNQSASGDRDGILTRDLQFQLTGGNLNNLYGTAVGLKPYGGDNEIVLTFFIDVVA